MRIITLFNKIAKGEEPPKNIEWEGQVYEYDGGIPGYFYLTKDDEIVLLMYELGIMKEGFNSKVKIIKENNNEDN